MKVSLLLADSAQAVAGKLYLLGGGWTVTGPEPSPFAMNSVALFPTSMDPSLSPTPMISAGAMVIAFNASSLLIP